MPKPKILLVGGLGYLGSRLATALSEHWEVSVATRSISPVRKQWLTSLSPKIHLTQLESPMRYEAVVHMAVPSAAECARDAMAARKSVQTSLGLCTEALRSGAIRRLIHFSSFHVYGTEPRPVYRESDTTASAHAYGEVHLAGEKIVKEHIDSKPAFILRVTNGIGAPAHPDLGPQSGLLYLDCLRQFAQTGKVVMKNDGAACRDFLPIGDIIRAVELLAHADSPSGDILNLSYGTSITLRHFVTGIAKHIREATGQEMKVEWGTGGDPFTSPFEVNHDRLSGWGWNLSGGLYEEVSEAFAFFRKAAAA